MVNNRQARTFHDKEEQFVNLDATCTTSPSEENGTDTDQSFPEYEKLLEFTESMAQISAAQERHPIRLDKIENQSEIT